MAERAAAVEALRLTRVTHRVGEVTAVTTCR